ncbi:MAG TPA: 16S rRNA (uracil(1498)-N(3))-methyltransferase [Anaeromyxobacter sp.]|nr:16S rRNA (uracil(1498)-N(3))-methyltransferase [Anaeromyxobacter sp.]
MTARRVFLPPERIAPGRAALTPEAIHYLRDVLRLAPGAALELFDGAGSLYAARIEDGFAGLALGERREARPALALWVLPALAKGEKMDLVVQKATELGATHLAPFAAERSIVRLEPEKAAARVERWRKIAAEAARQCGRADVPEVRAPARLQDALAAVPSGAARFVFHPGGAPLPADLHPAAVAAVVGPEGGLTEAEVAACEAAGARRASLGPRVLRAETAAVVATALLQARYGDLES